jgi:hypothetical protein
LTLIFDWLALRPDFRNHCPCNADAHVWRNLELDLFVVNDPRDFADEPAARDHIIAAANILEHIFLLLGLLALRPDDKQIGYNKNYGEGHHIDKDISCAGGPSCGSLSECGREQIPSPYLSIFRRKNLRPPRAGGGEYNQGRSESNGTGMSALNTGLPYRRMETAQ